MFLSAEKQTRLAAVLSLILIISLIPTSQPVFAQALLATIDDSVIGSGIQQFNYAGAGWEHCTECGQNVGAYGSSNSWNNVTDETLTIRFNGTHIAFYGVMGPSNGIAAVSVDDGAETEIDFYASATAGDHMLWQSAELSSGFHTFKLRITGTRNPNSGGNYIAPDRVDIYGKANAFNTRPVKAITAEFDQKSLDYRVIDAEYSTALDRLAIIADTPNALYIVDPNTGDSSTVKLAGTPKFVSVSPDGNFAAVAQLGLIAYVDLKTATILNTFDFPQMITDIVLGNGWIYVEPQGSNWQKLTAIEIATGKETTSTGTDFYYGTDFELMPDGSRLYGATQGTSSGGIVVANVGAGVPDVIGERSGDWYACGKLWISQDGKRLFSGFGGVFRTAVDANLDVNPNGRLAQIKYARHVFHSNAAGVILAIPESRPTPPCPNQGTETADRLLIYDYASLQLLNVVKLPSVGVVDATQPADGRFVFANAQGTKLYLVLQANQNSGALNDFAIAVGDLNTLKAPAQ